jgi:hypothetical protein
MHGIIVLNNVGGQPLRLPKMMRIIQMIQLGLGQAQPEQYYKL